MDIKRIRPKINPRQSSPDFNERADFFESPPRKQPKPEFRISSQKNSSLWKKIALWFLLIIMLLGISYGIFITSKVYVVSKKIGLSDKNTSFLGTIKSFTSPTSISNFKGAETGRINILLLGIAGKGKPGQNLTDTIIILSINTKTNQVALLSIPRDLYVEVPEGHFWTKINSVYQYGINSSPKDETAQIDPLMEVVKDLTSLDINYYAVLNFDGFKKMIDSIGGINVVNEKDLYDSQYPGPNYSYETFELEKGLHQMDGETALKYARVRHGDPEGDFGRAKRQQQVMQSFKNKFFSVGTFLNVFALNNFLNALGDNLKTNISTDEIGSFLELSKKLDTQNVNNMVLDAWNKDSLLKISRSIRETVGASALVPRIGNYSEIQELAQDIFDLNKIKRKREEISKENASVMIVNQSGDYSLVEKIRKLLSVNFDYKNIKVKNATDKTVADKTFVYDLTGGTKLFTLDELVKKLPAHLASDVPENIRRLVNPAKKSAETSLENNESADLPIVVVLGKDLVEIYNIEEGTIQDLENSRDNEEMINFKK
jgi:LCP family protein required for cell wall assembly